MACAGRRRGGFTLLEMLIVIGIIMIFLGLSVGAVMSTPRSNAMVGTEQLVADLVRQARHTARSTGSPVVIEILPGDRQVLGVSQIPLWNETWEGGTAGSLSVPAGLSGKGVTCIDGPTRQFPSPIPLTGADRLVRRTSRGRTEGFYLACAVRPPPAAGASVELIPLVLIGSNDETQCAAGLALQRVSRLVQDTQTLPDTTTGLTSQLQPRYDCWEIVGWVNPDPSGPGMDLTAASCVGSITHDPLPADALGQNTSGIGDVQGPLVGGSWTEIGLLFDGERVEVYRDGELLASKAYAPARLAGDLTASAAQFLHVGHGLFPARLAALSDQERVLRGVIDDTRLFRLGVDRPAMLPNGVAPMREGPPGTWTEVGYRLSVRPDGRLTTSWWTPTSAPVRTSEPLTFRQNSSQSTVRVTIAADGNVTSRIESP